MGVHHHVKSDLTIWVEACTKSYYPSSKLIPAFGWSIIAFSGSGNSLKSLKKKLNRKILLMKTKKKKWDNLISWGTATWEFCKDESVTGKLENKVPACCHVWLFVTPWTVCSLPGSSVYGNFPARTLEWLPLSFPGIFLTQGSKSHLLTLAGEFFTFEPPGKSGE